jgi:hypothetical protein
LVSNFPAGVVSTTWTGAKSNNPYSRLEQLLSITRLATFEERQERTDFDLGPTDQGPEVFAVQRLLFACYTAWLHGGPLRMDA